MDLRIVFVLPEVVENCEVFMVKGTAYRRVQMLLSILTPNCAAKLSRTPPIHHPRPTAAAAADAIVVVAHVVANPKP